MNLADKIKGRIELNVNLMPAANKVGCYSCNSSAYSPANSYGLKGTGYSVAARNGNGYMKPVKGYRSGYIDFPSPYRIRLKDEAEEEIARIYKRKTYNFLARGY